MTTPKYKQIHETQPGIITELSRKRDYDYSKIQTTSWEGNSALITILLTTVFLKADSLHPFTVLSKPNCIQKYGFQFVKENFITSLWISQRICLIFSISNGDCRTFCVSDSSEEGLPFSDIQFIRDKLAFSIHSRLNT